MDIIDRAQIREMVIIEEALAVHRVHNQRRDGVSPLYLDGVRCCLDCRKAIPPGRLKSNPDAVRCVACQEKREKSR